jgi:hypothetical protein
VGPSAWHRIACYVGEFGEEIHFAAAAGDDKLVMRKLEGTISNWQEGEEEGEEEEHQLLPLYHWMLAAK